MRRLTACLTHGVKTLLHQCLILTCALYLSGSHWMLLQTTAWTGMLIARSQRAPVAVAVETTFDGHHPCRVCWAITTGQNEEKQKEREFPAVKKMQEVKFVELARFELPTRVCSGEARWLDFVQVEVGRADAPPTPPPRA